MKRTTILYKDSDAKYYLGETANGALAGFKNIAISTETMKEADTFHNMDVNEFMILEVEEDLNTRKLTPLSIGSMTLDGATDGYGEPVKTQVAAIPMEEKLNIFNNVLKGRQLRNSPESQPQPEAEIDAPADQSPD